MDGELQIGAWAPTDRDDVVALILGIQQGEFGLPITIGDQPDVADPPSFYGASGGRFWVARRSGRVVGTIAALVIADERSAARSGVVRKMFVAPEARGGEVAGALMGTLVDWASAAGLAQLLLGTTAVMHGAHRFYAKHGFVEIPEGSLPATFPRMAVDSLFFRRALEGPAPESPEPAAAPPEALRPER